MLVIISDLHLTDGTSGQTIKTGAFQIFAERLQELARDASTRKSRSYRPIERIDLVLLGDILDAIRSTTWNQSSCKVRPWDDFRKTEFADQVQYVTDRILAHNRDSLDVLRAFKQGISLPVSDLNSKQSTVVVPVHTYYLVGNHDWVYHLPGTAYDSIRQAVVSALGLMNDPNIPFPHEPAVWPELLERYALHRVFARHGDIYDPDNYQNEARDGSSIGDAVVVELINEFTALVDSDPNLPQECKDALREIDNVRPLTMIPAWVYGTIRRSCGEHGDRIVQIWRQVTRAFLQVPFVRQHRLWLNPFRDIFPLWLGLALSPFVPLRLLSSLSALAGAGGDQPSYRDSMNEEWLKNGKAQSVVYRHTHRQLIVPLRATVDSSTNPQIYFNCGTWRPVHDLAVLQRNQQQFVGYHVLTYLTFFDGDEFNGHAFDSWSGTLDTE